MIALPARVLVVSLLLVASAGARAQERWAWTSPLPGGFLLSDVWGADPGDLFAVGARGLCIRSRGATWLAQDTGTVEDLYGVWGSSPDRVFAVGDGGTILRFDGSVWTPMTSGTTASLRAIWGIGDEVWVVGFASFALHLEGDSWVQVPSGATQELLAIWGSASNDVWAVGDREIVHYDGNSWSQAFSVLGGWFRGVAGSAPDDVWAVLDAAPSSAAYHFDGSVWDPVPLPTSYQPRDVVRTMSGRIFVLGLGGLILELVGGAWAEVVTPFDYGLYGSWSDSSREYAFGVGPAGAMAEFDGTEWSEVSERARAWDISGISGWRPNRLVAVGRSGSAVIMEYNGSRWQVVVNEGTGGLADVWAEASDLRVAVGRNGEIWTSTGSGWSSIAPNAAETLYSVWAWPSGDAFTVGHQAVAHQGVIRRRRTDGSGDWDAMSSGTSAALFAVWGASPDDVYAAGTGGTILHFDGSGWSTLRTGPESFRDVWGAAADDVYFVDWNGTLIHFDGTSWSQIPVPAQSCLWSISGSGPEDVWLLGCEGVSRFDGQQWSPVEEPAWGMQYPYYEVVWVDPAGVGWVGGPKTLVLRSPALFEDGFETGDGSAWTSTVP